MTRAVIVALVVLTASIALAEDPVVFPDANLKSAVESSLGIPDPTPTDMLGLDVLMGQFGGIADLSGLEHAANMTRAELSVNQIADLTPVSGLTNLAKLHVSNNQIADLSPVSGLLNLVGLGVSRNPITDLTPLSGLTNLNYLEMDYTHVVSDYSPLSGLTRGG